jgi:hypothetical protein
MCSYQDKGRGNSQLSTPEGYYDRQFALGNYAFITGIHRAIVEAHIPLVRSSPCSNRAG